MMELTEKAAIIHYHRHRIGGHEEGAVRALGYRSESSQQQRFEVLARVANLSGSSVLDVGCGYGDLKGFLDSRFYNFDYVGIDLIAEFVAKAKSRYGQRPSCYFCVADVERSELPRADYVFASGVFGYRCADPYFHLAMIDKMYRAADKALAFNMLDAGKFPDHPLLVLVGRDQRQIMRFCESLSPNVELETKYLEDDFTVFLRKTA